MQGQVWLRTPNDLVSLRQFSEFHVGRIESSHDERPWKLRGTPWPTEGLSETTRLLSPR